MSPQKLMLIDGAFVGGTSQMPVINPATGEAWTTVPRASEAQVGTAIQAARRAQPAWAALPWQERRTHVLALADAIDGRAGEIAQALVLEQGKPLAEAQGEVAASAIFLRAFADIELPVEVIHEDDALRVEASHKALGVVVGITPWNFPFLIAAYKLGPALMMGNSFILKPAPTTPVSALLLGELAANIFPAGVVGVIVDDNDLGPVFTAHPDVRKISFTGSTATGKRIMASAANTLKRLTLELGGNDAAIVLDDADVAHIAPRIFGAAFFNAGQVCIAIKRVYAHSSVYDALCEALAQLAGEAVVGDGLEQGVTVGPLQNAAQFAKARHYLDVAKRDGRVIAGGDIPERPGYYVPPTIVRDIDAQSALVAEEQFVPILPIVRFDDLDALIEEIAAGEYGLGGSVWSSDVARAKGVAERMDSGTIWINHHLHFLPNIPFPAAKASGIGVEFSKAGFAEFSQLSIISIAK